MHLKTKNPFKFLPTSIYMVYIHHYYLVTLHLYNIFIKGGLDIVQPEAHDWFPLRKEVEEKSLKETNNLVLFKYQ